MKGLQKKVEKFCKDNCLAIKPEHRLLDALSELGEVAKEILKMSDYGKKQIKSDAEIEPLKYELGDLLFSIITVANSFGISLEEALNRALEKYEKRLKKGSPGSEYD